MSKNYNASMLALGQAPSVIRETFEYGNRRAKEIGRENVFDFSLGNPSVPAPQSVQDTICHLVNTCDPIQLHGYTSAVGAEPVRAAIAANLNERYDAGLSANDLYMTCGAAASLTVTLHAILNPEDECITFAPFFPEYRVFVEATGAAFTVIPADTDSFQMNLKAFEQTVSQRTKAVIINTPNNPTGVVFTEENLRAFCEILRTKSAEYGHPIYLIADEPYRELVYDDTTKVPYLTKLYDETFVCYSFSKSLSLPGDRIGYIAVSPKMTEQRLMYAAICGAGRALGFVCAPSMMQKLLPSVLGTWLGRDFRRFRTIFFLCGATTALGSFISATWNISTPILAIYLTMLLFGGITTVAGPVIGAAVLLLVKEVFQSLALYQGLIYAVFILIILFFFPNGAVGVYYNIRAALAKKKGKNAEEQEVAKNA